MTNSIEQKVGHAWALGASACALLLGVFAVAVPVGLIFGETAGRWALGAVGTMWIGMTWLFVEAVQAWRLERGEGEPVPLQAVSRRSL